jgi:hypothetical protein
VAELLGGGVGVDPLRGEGRTTVLTLAPDSRLALRYVPLPG